MDKDIIRWGIIGCGDVTEVKSGPAFNKVPHSKLVAVMRRNGEKAKDYAQRHGVGKWYTDAEALINDVEVNAIYIATPPAYHEEYAIKALRANKPVYVEKPFALNVKGAQKIVDVVNETGVKLTVAHYRRQQPLFKKIKSLLSDKIIGDVKLVQMDFLQQQDTDVIAQTEIPWRLDPSISGGGLFYDLAPHGLDLMMYLFGNSIKASGISFNAQGLYAADDTTSGSILFDKHVLFNGRWRFTVPEKRDNCEIIGTKGKISFSIFDSQPIVIVAGDKEDELHFDRLPHVQQPMIAKVVSYFREEGANPCSGEEGLKVMKMMEALTQKDK